MKVLAEFTTYSHDGEAWTATIIFSKFHEMTEEEKANDKPHGKRVTRIEAIDAAEKQGYTERLDSTMGGTHLNAPSIQGAFGIWIIQQTGYANV